MGERRWDKIEDREGGLVKLRRIRRGAFLLLPVLTLNFFLPGTARMNLPVRTRPIVISIVPKSLDNPMYIEVKEAAELAAREQNVVVEWVGPFKVDVETQIRIIEGLIRRKVDGIAVCCSDEDRLVEVIDQAVDAGIKVATFGADAPQSKRLFYCGADNYQAGLECGRAMVRLVQEKGWADRPLNTVILTGDLNAHDLKERMRGFKEATAGRINLNYRAVLACNEDTTTAAKEVEAYLKKHPETDVFFFTGGWAFLGPPEAMPLYDQWCQRGGLAVSMDTFYPVLQAAQRGFVQVLVGPNYRKMGELIVNNLVRAINELPLPSTYFETGLELADRNNFGKLLQTKKPWDIK